MPPRTVLRLAVLGVAASSVILVLISAISGLSITDSLAMAGPPLIIAAFFSVAKLILQGARFYIIQRTFSDGMKLPVEESFRVRIASEFVAMAGVSYVGDELFRTAYLIRRGLPAGRSLWLAYFEIFLDVFVGGTIGVAAGLRALSRGAFQIGIVLTTIAAVILSVYGLAIYWSLTGRLALPSLFRKTLQSLIGRRLAASLTDFLDRAASGFCEASQLILRRRAFSSTILALLLTFAIAGAGAATLIFLAERFGHSFSFFDSLLAVYASITLATLPVTLGGSGVSELGLYFYLRGVFGVDELPMVVAWRLASFHIPLFISAMILLTLLRKALEFTRDKARA